jgi:enamine deaminase RidA (YjgF/YER057c/UK114 family)
VIDHNSYKEIFVSGITGNNDEDIQRISDEAFSLMEKILEAENMDFSNIVRQWNYIEDITSNSGDSQKYQHYQVFNDIRSEYYNKSKFNNGYPSATGIGAEAFGVIINFIAISNASNVKLIPVANPEQIDAHRYSQKVLVGEEYHKTSPKFERGKLVITDEGSKMYISGTAAIVGEDTLFPGDVKKQTMVTVNNIKQLVKNGQILQSKDTQLDRNRYTYIRAYVKYKKDLDIVMEICEKHFTSECFQFLVSDICRDDLLVEIEGLIEI